MPRRVASELLEDTPTLLRNISKMLRDKSFDLEQSLEQFMVLLKLKSAFKRISQLTIRFGVRISKHWYYLSRKFEVVARFNSLRETYFLKFQNNFTAEF